MSHGMGQRRLSSSIRPQKKQRSFWGVFVFILCMAILSGIGIYYFLKEKTISESPVLKAVVLDLEDGAIALRPNTSEEHREELALIDDLYKTSDVVQLYRAQESASKSYNYWRYPLKRKRSRDLSCAIIIENGDVLDKKALKKLQSLELPLGIIFSASHKKLSDYYICAININADLPFDDLGKELDRQIGQKPCMAVISKSAYSPLTLELLLIHLKQRGLIFIDTSSMPKKTLEDVSYKVLALSLKGTRGLMHQKIKGKTVIIVALNDLLSPKGKKWLSIQKEQKVHFVSLDQLF